MTMYGSWPFIRKCQSCGHQAEYKDPATYKDKTKEAWRDVKCKKCGSVDLDYGSRRPFTPEQIAEYEAWEAKQEP